MAHTIIATDHLPALTEDGFSYSFLLGFNYEGTSRILPLELRKFFGFETEESITEEVADCSREEISDSLRELCIPIKWSDTTEYLRGRLVAERVLQLQMMQRKGQSMTKKELMAQLKLYGVEFNARLGAGKLRDLLVESIKSGQCNRPTRSVADIETRLHDEYKRLDKIETTRIAKERQEEFNKKYPDPNVAAVVDPKLFISQYFLTYEGRPDLSKTINPIVITKLTHSEAWQIQEAVRILFRRQEFWNENYLYCLTDGPDGGPKVVSVGWNNKAVSEALKKATKPLYEQQEADDKHLAEQRMTWHRMFAAGLSKDRIPCTLKNIQGRYLVTCEEIETQWPDDVRKSNGMRMRIIPEVGNVRRNLVAEFHFGVMEGLMRFRRDGIRPAPRWPKSNQGKEKEKERQKEKEKEKEKIAKDPASKQPNTLKKDENDRPKHICSPSTCGLKRKISDINPSTSKRIRGTMDLDEPDPTKFRLVFHFRAREVGEGELQYGTGWIEWDLKDCTTFKGELTVGFIGMSIPFYGYKTESLVKGAKRCSEWEEYSDDPYENRRFARLFR